MRTAAAATCTLLVCSQAGRCPLPCVAPDGASKTTGTRAEAQAGCSLEAWGGGQSALSVCWTAGVGWGGTSVPGQWLFMCCCCWPGCSQQAFEPPCRAAFRRSWGARGEGGAGWSSVPWSAAPGAHGSLPEDRGALGDLHRRPKAWRARVTAGAPTPFPGEHRLGLGLGLGRHLRVC